jgi:hypothetical protein
MSTGYPLPSVVPPTLANWQIQFNGLVIGAGTDYGIDRVEGLDLPVVANGDVARPRATGEFIGLDLMRGRDITVTMDAAKITGASLQADLQALASAFIPPADGQTEIPFWLQLPNLPLLCASARVRKRQIPIDVAWSNGLAEAIIISLHATDPRLYGPTFASTVVLANPSAGVKFPVTFPLSFGSGGTSTVSITNTGNISMNPIITITGPVTTPVIENETSGLLLQFANPAQTGYTLNAGDTLVINTDAHTVFYYPSGATSGESVRSWLVFGSSWWNLAPGNNTIQFTSQDASTPSPAPTCTVDWAPAYVSAT